MIKLLLGSVFSALLLLLIACGGDNAYDGENGLFSAASSASVTAALETLDAAVLKAVSAQTLTDANATEAAIDALYNDTNETTLQAAQTAFKTLASGWKKTQAVYMAGEYDRNLRDTPDLIDFFHTGNEDIAAGLDSIIAGSGNLNTALYKNSHKGFDALEYLLFGSIHDNTAQLAALQANGKRRIEAAQIAVASLKNHLTQMSDFYQNDTQFIEGGGESVEALLNKLIDSAYKLKEWRVGDPAGFTLKYLGDPDETRLEYVRSGYSKEAVSAILAAHRIVMDNGLGMIAAEGGAANEAALVQAKLTDAIAAAEAFNGTLADELTDAKMRALYDAIDGLYDAYYGSLIGALSLTADIVEADGD